MSASVTRPFAPQAPGREKKAPKAEKRRKQPGRQKKTEIKAAQQQAHAHRWPNGSLLSWR
jgi:hypothetical protein